MESILYITGGIALLAVAWFFYSAARMTKSVERTLRVSNATLTEARHDIQTLTQDFTQIKTQLMPIMDNVTQLTDKFNSIADGVQTQMVSIQDTVDDTLDVVRGTLDDIERLKDSVVGTVEGPLTLVRTGTQGAVGAVQMGFNLIKRLVEGKKNSNGSLPKDDIAEELHPYRTNRQSQERPDSGSIN